MPIFKSW